MLLDDTLHSNKEMNDEKENRSSKTLDLTQMRDINSAGSLENYQSTVEQENFSF